MQKLANYQAIYATLLIPAAILFVWAFSPFGNYFLAFFMLPVLFALVRHWRVLHLFLYSWLFFSVFFAASVYWIYFSMHVYGNLNRLEVIAMIIGFAAYLGLYPALAIMVSKRLQAFESNLGLFVILPSIWVLFEWARGWLFTGFPWMSLGYSQTPSVFGQLASLFGVYGVSALVVALSALIFKLFENQTRNLLLFACLVFLLGLFEWWLILLVLIVLVIFYFIWQKRLIVVFIPALALLAYLYSFIPWTQPLDNDNLKVALLQGNINQGEKWKKPRVSIELYQMLSDQALLDKPDLVVWPETAVPAYLNQVQNTLIAKLYKIYQDRGTEFILGIPVSELRSMKNTVVVAKAISYNSAIKIGAYIQTYHKVHLVPFGEYTPFYDWFSTFYDNLNIEMNNFSKGDARQTMITVKDNPVALFICYEIAFPHEVIRLLPKANLLVSLSNNAWFFNPKLRRNKVLATPWSYWIEDSSQSYQQLQMAQMRAIETGRQVLSATNDGVTAIIGHDGDIERFIPRYQIAILQGSVQLRTGSTPFVFWGNWLVIGLIVLILAYFAGYRSGYLSLSKN